MITFQVTMDAADPDRLARFWAEMLGYKLQDPPPGFDTWEAWAEQQGIPKERWNDFSALIDPEGKRARFFFQRVPRDAARRTRGQREGRRCARHGTRRDRAVRERRDGVALGDPGRPRRQRVLHPMT